MIQKGSSSSYTVPFVSGLAQVVMVPFPSTVPTQNLNSTLGALLIGDPPSEHTQFMSLCVSCNKVVSQQLCTSFVRLCSAPSDSQTCRLFGVTSIQTKTYFNRYPHDIGILKYLVIPSD